MNLDNWDWPYLRTNLWGVKEYLCPCGVGHGGVHGCCSEGCCSHPSFLVDKQWENKHEKEEKE